MRKLITIACLALLTLPVAGTPPARAAGPTDSRKWSPPLLYHGGPVMIKVKNYLVFWTGGNSRAFDSRYVSLLQRWQKDARHTTVFKSTMQYAQADGQHPTDTAYGGTFTNSSPFPGKGPCAKVCVGEADIARIARTTAAAHRVKPGMNTIVYVYTPAGVRKCNKLENGNTECYDDDEGPAENGAECEWVFGPTLPNRRGNTHYDGHLRRAG